MSESISIRELTRNGSRLNDFDYVDIEDKKSHQYKGLFVSERYALEVKEFLEKRIAQERHAEKEALLGFAGLVEGDFGEKSFKEWKEHRGDQV